MCPARRHTHTIEIYKKNLCLRDWFGLYRFIRHTHTHSNKNIWAIYIYIYMYCIDDFFSMKNRCRKNSAQHMIYNTVMVHRLPVYCRQRGSSYNSRILYYRVLIIGRVFLIWSTYLKKYFWFMIVNLIYNCAFLLYFMITLTNISNWCSVLNHNNILTRVAHRHIRIYRYTHAHIIYDML